MADIDRLPWTGGVSFVNCGVRVGIRVNDRRVLPRVLACVPPRSRIARARAVDHLYSLQITGRRSARLYDGARRQPGIRTLEAALYMLRSSLEFTIATHAPTLLFVHAGVVGWRRRAILIPGRSFSGKTTLVAALVRAGAVYYSDEFAVFDERGRVHAWPRPLMVRTGRHRYGRPRSVEELGGRAGHTALPVGVIALTRRVAGSRWRPRDVSPGEAVLGLFDNTVLARSRPAAALRILHRAAANARAIASRRDEADEAVATLLSARDL